MFNTVRDPEFTIIVPAWACSIYNSKSQGEMIEVKTPTESISGYTNTDSWGSIMLKKEQLRRLDEALNVIYVNNPANIVNSVKDPVSRAILSSEELLPTEIMGRWLKYYRYAIFNSNPGMPAAQLDLPSRILYQDYVMSRMRQEDYLNRLPRIVTPWEN